MTVERSDGTSKKYEDDAEKSEACVLVFSYYVVSCVVSGRVSRGSDRLFFVPGDAGKKMGDHVSEIYALHSGGSTLPRPHRIIPTINPMISVRIKERKEIHSVCPNA